MGTQGGDQDVIGQAGQVAAGPVQGVLRYDGYPGLLRVGRPEDGGHGPDSAGDDLIGPAEGIPGLHFLKEGPVRMLPHPLVQKSLETVLRGADEGKGSLGPAVPGLVVRKGLEEHGPSGLVKVSVPYRVWSVRSGPRSQNLFDGGQQTHGSIRRSEVRQPMAKARLDYPLPFRHSVLPLTRWFSMADPPFRHSPDRSGKP